MFSMILITTGLCPTHILLERRQERHDIQRHSPPQTTKLSVGDSLVTIVAMTSVMASVSQDNVHIIIVRGYHHLERTVHITHVMTIARLFAWTGAGGEDSEV